MRVLLLLHELSLTGAPRVILDAFEALEGAIDVRAVALRDGPLADRCARLAPPFIPAAPAYGRLDRLRGWPQSVRARKEARSLARWQPDLIYVNSVAALRVVSRIGLPSAPVLLHVHELDVVTARLLQGVDPELLTCWPDRYIAVSEPVARLLADRYGVDRDRISLIHEFVPDGLLDGYRYSAPRSDGAPLVVGGAGTPEWRKGTVLWLQMAVELVRLLGREQVRFRWVGLREDAESLYFAHMVRKLGLAEQVDLIPVTPDPFPHYVDFDVFAMTSWEDPCPIVVLENMALGTPVACYAGSGGAPEVVGDTGFVASGFSPQAMACGIAELACDTDRLHARGKALSRRGDGNRTRRPPPRAREGGSRARARLFHRLGSGASNPHGHATDDRPLRIKSVPWRYSSGTSGVCVLVRAGRRTSSRFSLGAWFAAPVCDRNRLLTDP